MIEKALQNERLSILWLVVRVWLGYQWLIAGIHKLTDPSGVWVGEKAGAALTGFLSKAAGLLTGPDGTPIPAGASYEWYRSFAEFLVNSGATSWFTYLVVLGEIAVGLGLIFGIFTTVAAIGGAFMNLNFMLAGTASTNPVLFIIAIILILAGSAAGRLGADHYLLPWLRRQWGKSGQAAAN